MQLNIFREYDIRGIVGSELVIEECYDLARAIVTYLRAKNPTLTTVIVGRDGRLHSTAIWQQIVAGITQLGYDVIDIGVCPTPAAYFAVHHLGIQNMLMITASHNPGEYNGIKLWDLAGPHIRAIRDLFAAKTFIAPIGAPGSITNYPILPHYLDCLEEKFSHLKGIAVNAIFDCGNGAAGTMIADLIARMGWQNTELLYEAVDGTFPNHEPDPTVAEHMNVLASMLRVSDTYTLGIGFDGDCDRMNPMTHTGHLVPGDHMLALFAKSVLATHPNAAVVCDIKSSGSLIDVLKSLGAVPCIAASGHANIKSVIKENHAMLGGELSCHFFFHDRYFGFDDGIYAALRTIEMVHQAGTTLEALLQSIPHKVSSPEIRIACAAHGDNLAIVESIKQIFAARTDLELITIDGIRAHMDYGWGLLRASNTQPVISLRFESDSAAGLKRVKEEFFLLLTPYFDEHLLRTKIEL